MVKIKLILFYRWLHNFGLFWPTWTPNSRGFSVTLSQASKLWTRLLTSEATEDVRKRLLWSPTVVSTKAEKAKKKASRPSIIHATQIAANAMEDSFKNRNNGKTKKKTHDDDFLYFFSSSSNRKKRPFFSLKNPQALPD